MHHSFTLILLAALASMFCDATSKYTCNICLNLFNLSNGHFYPIKISRF